jgi:hypothetical protein
MNGRCAMCDEPGHPGLCKLCDHVRDLHAQAALFSHQSADVSRLEFIRMTLADAAAASGDAVTIGRQEATYLLELLADAVFIAETYVEAQDMRDESLASVRGRLR